MILIAAARWFEVQWYPWKRCDSHQQALRHSHEYLKGSPAVAKCQWAPTWDISAVDFESSKLDTAWLMSVEGWKGAKPSWSETAWSLKIYGLRVIQTSSERSARANKMYQGLPIEQMRVGTFAIAKTVPPPIVTHWRKDLQWGRNQEHSEPKSNRSVGP